MDGAGEVGEQGAATSVWAAGGPELEGVHALAPASAERLWSLSEQLVARAE
ncbi:MAG TPA: hypothetical protein VHR17_07330 [Thermoanaerobaculia bacterium]|nr:hypothetical protein [Thermoanaerobaculia bacterium]